MFLARAHDRLLITGLAELTTPAATSPIRRAARACQAALDDLTTERAYASPHASTQDQQI
jgi:hypothetical protein